MQVSVQNPRVEFRCQCETLRWDEAFCLQLEASCLQLSFSAYSGAWELFCFQLELLVTIGALLLTVEALSLTIGKGLLRAPEWTVSSEAQL